LDDLGPATPYALWVRGTADLRFGCLRAVAIVGSRAATAYGSYVAAEVSSSVAARGWTIVSGAAYGVDGSAHRGALGVGGTTIAVMACGVDQPYPAGHADLLDAIAEGGAVVSEWPPGRNATRLRFLVRNRVIAALSTATVVVEAAERSGAVNTARHARDLSRGLMAVPGPVTSQQSAGCHMIIRDWDGTLVTSAADVLEMVTPLGEGGGGGGGEAGPGNVSDEATPAGADASQTASRAASAAAPLMSAPLVSRDALDLESAAVLDALPVRGGLGTTAVAARAGVAPITALRCLGELAAGGFAERCEAGWRIRRI
jgi:DNA processing protein